MKTPRKIPAMNSKTRSELLAMTEVALEEYFTGIRKERAEKAASAEAVMEAARAQADREVAKLAAGRYRTVTDAWPPQAN